jgi:hypothetical protein
MRLTSKEIKPTHYCTDKQLLAATLFVLQYQNMLMHHVYCSRKLPGIARQCKSAISVETVITKSKQVPAAASSESLYQTHSQPIWPGNPVHPFLRLLHISIPLLVGDFNPSEKY